jgi:putative sigma-54 modulation protein
MRLNVKLRDPRVEQEHVESIERRAHFALGRFGNHINRTEVILSDNNGPRGGRDKQCTVRVLLIGLPPVVVKVTDFESISAVSRAVDRAARHVRDNLNRRRDVQRLREPDTGRFPGE